MHTGMLALASGLMALRFLPGLPPGGWLLSMLVAGLLLLIIRFYPAGLFLIGLT